jgi:hypothetical protein
MLSSLNIGTKELKAPQPTIYVQAASILHGIGRKRSAKQRKHGKPPTRDNGKELIPDRLPWRRYRRK